MQCVLMHTKWCSQISVPTSIKRAYPKFSGKLFSVPILIRAYLDENFPKKNNRTGTSIRNLRVCTVPLQRVE